MVKVGYFGSLLSIGKRPTARTAAIAARAWALLLSAATAVTYPCLSTVIVTTVVTVVCGLPVGAINLLRTCCTICALLSSALILAVLASVCGYLLKGALCKVIRYNRRILTKKVSVIGIVNTAYMRCFCSGCYCTRCHWHTRYNNSKRKKKARFMYFYR